MAGGEETVTRAYVKAVGPTPPGFHGQADYAAYRRFRIGDQHMLRICRDCGSVFPDHHCHWQEPEARRDR